jgi:uncharacterized protein YecE (DUF72 family)
MKYHVGTSGWIYKDWAKLFYPNGAKTNDQKLKYYAENFNTVEINNSFYRLPSVEAFANWRDVSPTNFTFSVKLSRFLTHIKKLNPDERTNEGIDRFASRAITLVPKLGPVLIQLPHWFKASEDKVINLAKEFQKAESKYCKTFQLALEVRHDSWFDDQMISILKHHNVALVVNSAPDIWPFSCEITADFAYFRFHGSKSLYRSAYTNNELEHWAKFIKAKAGQCNTVYAYFNNDKSARAVDNAKYLAAILNK